jgi:hypothetical protein
MMGAILIYVGFYVSLYVLWRIARAKRVWTFFRVLAGIILLLLLSIGFIFVA